MTVIYREDFETVGNGTRYTTSVPEFTDLSGDFFLRTDGSDIGSYYEVSGYDGSYFFGVMDTNGDGNPASVSLTISDIDISGYQGLGFSGLFAEDDDGLNQDWDADALVYVEVNIDGAGWTKILQFASEGATNTEPGLDTDFDGVADGTKLTAAFAEFTASIAGTGSLLDLRVTFENLEAGDEDIALDDLVITASQKVVLNETFETAAGFTTSTAFFSDGYGDYFGLAGGASGDDFGAGTAPTGLKAYTNTDGAFLTGMDLDAEGDSVPFTVTWAGLDISGLENLTFSGDFAEFFDDPGDIDAADYITLEASIDGGAAQTVMSFLGADFYSSVSNGVFRRDTNLDGSADGAALTDAFANFTAAIAGTGSTLDLTLTVSVDSGDEDFAVDNFKIIGDTGATVTPAVVASTGDGLSVAEEGETTDTFTLALTTTPSADVTVAVAAADGQSLVSLDGVTYAASVDVVLSDTTPATVHVQAVDDSTDEGDPHSGAITFAVTSPDGDYDGKTINPLSVSIADNDTTITLISAIQGSGDTTPVSGQEVTVEAIVTGLIMSGSNIVGYFLQEEDADSDGDAATSEGIYVYNYGATVSVGDKLRVTGTAGEYSGQTQISSVSNTQVIATGETLPTVTQITLGMSADFEAYESMRVELVTGGSDPLTVITNYNLDRYGEVQVAEGNQVQGTQIYDPETEAATIAAHNAANLANRLTIDDGSTSQNPDVYKLIDAGDGTPLDTTDDMTNVTLRLGAELTSVTGVMDYRYGGYRIQSEGPLDTVPGTNAGARESTAPDVGGDLQVASFNVLNYFTTLDDGSLTGPNGDLDPRGATTAGDLTRQTDKIVAALAEIDADIFALQELENNGFGSGSAIAALVDALNAEVGAGTYAFVDPATSTGFVGKDAITTGLIYKTGAVSLVGASVLDYTEASAAATWALVDQIQDLTGTTPVGDYQRNRPTIAATFMDADGSEVTITSNHFKSKGASGLDSLLADAIAAAVDPALIAALQADPNFDQGDGQGFWNGVRTDAAVELASWLATNPTGASDGTQIVSLGDMNAYAMENPVQAMVDAGYLDLAAELITDAYSYVFDGMRGTLDYAMASLGIFDNVMGAAEWHINADETDLLNYSSQYNDPAFYNLDPFASSDHDPMLVGLELDDPALLTALSFDTSGVGIDISIVREDYNNRSTSVDAVTTKFTVKGGQIKVKARDGFKTADYVTGEGDGLGVLSDKGDTTLAEQQSVNDTDVLIFKLADSNKVGDAQEVTFDFVNTTGTGDVALSFFDNGVLVDQATVAIVNDALRYDLAGATTFDKVEIGATGDLMFQVSDVSFDRTDDLFVVI